MDIDGFQEEIGGITTYQVLIILFGGLITFGSGFTSQAAVFLSAVPDFRCAVPPIDDPNVYPSLDESDINNYTIPYDSATAEYDSCNRYNYNLTSCRGDGDLSCVTSDEDPGSIPCDQGYYYDPTYYDETTITQWDLVCDRQYLDSLANTLFFLGFFIGSAFVGPLSDWFGRKLAMIVLCIGLVSCSVGCAFAPTFEIYTFVRVLCGAFGITCFISYFTYASEICPINWRVEAGAYAQMTTAIAHTVYPWIAYALRDWHDIQLTIGLIPAAFFVVYFFIPESPRWLLRNGKPEEAKKIIARYAQSKNKKLTDEKWNSIVQFEKKKEALKEEEEKTANKIGVWDLFRRPLMRLMSFNVMISWFTVSMVFYGLALNGGNLAGDPYLNTTLNAVVEIAAYVFVYFSTKLGRRPVFSASYILAGISCIASMLFDLYANGDPGLFTASTVMAIAGKFFASIGFALAYSVTGEIFPTNARTTGLSLGSMAARVGGMIAPFVLQLQTTIPWFTQTIFGTLSIISGLLTLLYPETSNAEYMTTLDEAEDFYWENIKALKWIGMKRPEKSSSKLDMESKANPSFNGTLDELAATKL
ncbi:organic cation transporter-like protein [Clavelina lepadiformis]|uniref:organic cation transporter-like protein n=1 Tax=Clavelina lepadiformis TaxID=159417 RepID=UPI0040432CF0